MSDFLGDIARFNVNVLAKAPSAVFDGVIDETFRSIVDGSQLTGAPSLPTAPDGVPNAGKLRDSVTVTRPDANTAVISTDVDYASNVEDNLEGAHFHTGGPHGWKLTVAGFPRIVQAVGQRVASG